jgi:hypothetical protein
MHMGVSVDLLFWKEIILSKFLWSVLNPCGILCTNLCGVNIIHVWFVDKYFQCYFCNYYKRMSEMQENVKNQDFCHQQCFTLPSSPLLQDPLLADNSF